MTPAHILCPVDFSEVSAHALEQATVVAGWYHAKLSVLHVHAPALPAVAESFGVSMPAGEVGPATIQRLQEAVRSFAGPAIGAERQVDVTLDGPPAQQILARRRARRRYDRDGSARPQRHRSVVVRLDDEPGCPRRLVPGPDGPRETVTGLIRNYQP